MSLNGERPALLPAHQTLVIPLVVDGVGLGDRVALVDAPHQETRLPARVHELGLTRERVVDPHLPKEGTWPDLVLAQQGDGTV
jgi:hypothetical protein